jgi:hypothetical protein
MHGVLPLPPLAIVSDSSTLISTALLGARFDHGSKNSCEALAILRVGFGDKEEIV